MDNILKAKIAISALSLFIIIWLLGSGSEAERCDGHLEMTRKAYSMLYGAGVIHKVVVSNGGMPYDIAFDSVVVEDKCELEEIRKLLNNRVRFVWQRRSSVWKLDITLLLKDGNALQLRLEKFDTDKADSDSYRIYEDCNPSFESGAMELAAKIIKLIGDSHRASR